jgi:hypothetical protein
MSEAIAPVVNMLCPMEASEDPAPSFLSWVQQVAGRLEGYVRSSLKDCVGQLLASVQAFFPDLDLAYVSGGMSEDCTKERFQVPVDEVAPIVDEYLKSLEEDGQ